MVSDKKLFIDNKWQATVLSAQDYYPFGMSMPNRKWQSSSTYRFDFNGKEKDPETELNDFGARFYAANIGRWLSIDPLAYKFPAWSPYVAMNDNPIAFIDPDGMKADWIFDEQEDGSYKRREGVENDGGENMHTYYSRNGDVHIQKVKEGITNHYKRSEDGTLIPLDKDMLFRDKKSNNFYLNLSDGGFNSFASTTINGEAVEITPTPRMINPDYRPYNPAAAGFQATVSVDLIVSSYSFTVGGVVGPGQIGVFVTGGAGNGPLKPAAPSVSGSVTFFVADKTDFGNDENGKPIVETDISNLNGHGIGVCGTYGIATGGYFQSSKEGSLIPEDGYKGISFGLSTPGYGVKFERTYTKMLIFTNK